MKENKNLSTYKVPKEFYGFRFDKVINNKFKDLSYSKIQKLVRVGFFKVNKLKVKANYVLKENDIIQYNNFTFNSIQGKNKDVIANSFIEKKYIKNIRSLKKLIIFQDDNLLVINKPSGIAVQGGSKVDFNIDVALPYLTNSTEKLRLVHRIDKSTSGLLVLAKSKDIARDITMLFKEKKIFKKYWAIVLGVPQKKSGHITLPIIKKEVFGIEKMVIDKKLKDNAFTKFRLLTSNNNLSLMELIPSTGKKHQLRVHMCSLKNPILGDIKYSKDIKGLDKKNIKLHLHAKELKFILNKKKYSFKAEIPEYFKKTVIDNNLKIKKNDKVRS